MTKQEFIGLAASKFNLKKIEVEEVYNLLIESIKDELKTEGEFRISGIGTLKKVTRASREARNPKTGEKIIVPEKKTITFKVAKELKELVNE